MRPEKMAQKEWDVEDMFITYVHQFFYNILIFIIYVHQYIHSMFLF